MQPIKPTVPVPVLSVPKPATSVPVPTPKPSSSSSSPVTVTVPPLVGVDPVSFVPNADVTLIYGTTRSWKTTQIASLVEYFYELYGLPSRLFTAEEGAGLEPLLPYVEAGMLEYIPLNDSVQNPLSLIDAVSRGSWLPLKTVQGKQKLTGRKSNGLDEGKVAAYFVEGLQTIGDRILKFMGNNQIKLAQDVTSAVTVESYDEDGQSVKYGQASQSHYNFVQNNILGMIPRFASLPVKHVVFTSHEAKGEDTVTRAPVYGPACVGKAVTSKIPVFVGDMFHNEIYTEVDGKTGAVSSTVRAYFTPHPDSQLGTVTWPAGPRSVAELAPKIRSRWPNGYLDLSKDSIRDFFEFKKQLKSDLAARLRAKKAELDAKFNSQGNDSSQRQADVGNAG